MLYISLSFLCKIKREWLHRRSSVYWIDKADLDPELVLYAKLKAVASFVHRLLLPRARAHYVTEPLPPLALVHCETDKTNTASVPDPPFFARGGLRQTTRLPGKQQKLR